MKRINKNGLSLVFCTMFANVVALGFNALLGRILSYETFGVLTFISALYIFLYIIANAAAYTVTHKVAYFQAKSQTVQVTSFYDSFARIIMRSSIIATIIFIIISPFLTIVFKLPSYLTLILFSSAISSCLLLSLYRGYLQGNLDYLLVGLLVIGEAVARLIVAGICIGVNHTELVYVSIPFADVLVSAMGYLVLRKRLKKPNKKSHFPFPTAFFNAAIITGFSSYAFVTFDVLLVKMFVSPKVAGMYALLALVGKIIYFLGSVLNSVLFTIVSRDLGLDYNPYPTFYRFATIVFILVAGAAFILSFFSNPLVPMLFGAKTIPVLQYLPTYATGIACFTLSSMIVTFHLAKEEYLFSVIAIASAIIMGVIIAFYHTGIQEIVTVICGISFVTLIILITLHFLTRYTTLIPFQIVRLAKK